MQRRVTTWAATCVLLAGPLFADSPVKSYQEARQVLDAGIQAMGGLEALRGIKACLARAAARATRRARA